LPEFVHARLAPAATTGMLIVCTAAPPVVISSRNAGVALPFNAPAPVGPMRTTTRFPTPMAAWADSVGVMTRDRTRARAPPARDRAEKLMRLLLGSDGKVPPPRASLEVRHGPGTGGLRGSSARRV